MTPTGSMPTNTSMAAAVQKTAAPMAMSYPQASANQQTALKEQTGMIGHNVFRPDIYRVSGGYLS